MAQWLVPLILSYLWLATIIVYGGELKDPLNDPIGDGHSLEDIEDIHRVLITPEEYVKIDGEGPRMTKKELIYELREKIGPDYEKSAQYLALRRNINMLFGDYDYDDLIEVPIFYIEEQDNKDAALLHAARLLKGIDTDAYRIYEEALNEREYRYKLKLGKEANAGKWKESRIEL